MATQSSLYIARIDSSPIGCIEVQAGENGLLSVTLGGSAKMETTKPCSDPASEALHQILEYLEGKRREFDIMIDWSFQKPFQSEVLRLTQRIPFGSTKTYGQIAREMGKPAASRAVGGALGRNPIPIFLPCHRVVAADGSLTGFSAADGLRAKRWLLELEGHRFVGEKLA
jgi:methylated-DNA-[protein]-cysteine S-methyltransferase